MFEKEAEEYLKKDGTKAEQILSLMQGKIKVTIKQIPFILAAFQQIFIDGAEFAYNKANEWHNIRENPDDLPTDTSALYYVLVYSWTFGFSHLYKKYGIYIPTVCEWNGEYFKALDRDAYTNARNIKNCLAWKEIVLPELKECEV